MYTISYTPLFCWTITLSFNFEPPISTIFSVQLLKLCLSEIRNQRWANSRRGIGQNLGCFSGETHRVGRGVDTGKHVDFWRGFTNDEQTYVNIYLYIYIYVDMCICYG